MSATLPFARLLTLDPAWVRQRIGEFLAEDRPQGDITTLATIPAHLEGQAQVLAAQPCVFAGAQVLPECFPDSCQVILQAADGQAVGPQTILAEIRGPARELLSCERVMLNLLQRLCGIATLTRSFVERDIPPGFKILDTRKTTPGLRLFEKYAVAVGGGWNHRLNLSEAILIKDNHLAAAGGIAPALAYLRQHYPHCHIELEVDTLEQLHQGLEQGIQAFLLDNMFPQQVARAVEMVRAWPGGEQVFLEASGGITAATLPDYARTGIDGVSIGALTTQAVNVDIKLEMYNAPRKLDRKNGEL